jgi:hypothetical protein
MSLGPSSIVLENIAVSHPDDAPLPARDVEIVFQRLHSQCGERPIRLHEKRPLLEDASGPRIE